MKHFIQHDGFCFDINKLVYIGDVYMPVYNMWAYRLQFDNEDLYVEFKTEQEARKSRDDLIDRILSIT